MIITKQVYGGLKDYAIVFLFFFLFCSINQTLHAATDSEEEGSQQVVLKLFMDKKPVTYITGEYLNDEYFVRLYEILDILGYQYEADWSKHTFTGYFPIKDKGYTISEQNIAYFKQKGIFSKDIKWDGIDLFISIPLLKKLYNISVETRISELAMFMQSDLSAPYRIKLKKDEELKKFLENKKAGSLENVDTIPLGLFKVNSLGYSILTTTNLTKPRSVEWDANLSMNGELVHGSYFASYDYLSDETEPWGNKLRFNWAKTDIKSKWIKTVMVDHDYPSLTTLQDSHKSSATSLTISNSDKESYLDRNYTYVGKTKPNVGVEIYNNGHLIDYVVADSLGNYSANIPISSSQNQISAVSYNSYGIPVSNDKMVFMPTGLQPRGQYIYKLTSGITDYGTAYVAPTIEYGLTNWLTGYAGNETTFSRNRTTSIVVMGTKLAFRRDIRWDVKYIPTVMVSTRLYGNIIPTVTTNFLYQRYNRHQHVVDTQVKDYFEMGLNGSLPTFMRGNYNISMNYTNFKYGKLFSTYSGLNFWRHNFLGSFYINTTAQDFQLKYPSYTLKLGYYFSLGLYNEATVQYLTYQKTFAFQENINYQFKNKLTAFANASYYLRSKQMYLNVGISWRLPFMRNRTGVVSSGKSFSAYTQFSGAIQFHTIHNVSFSENYTSGSSLMVILFVDKNGNGKYDKGELVIKKPEAFIKLNSAYTKKTNKGILFTDIRPDEPFKLVVPHQKFEDISWQFDDFEKNMMLTNEQSTTVYIPIHVLTELSGQVYTVKHGDNVGVANMAVVITNKKTHQSTTVYTDDWGYYIYMGVTCGQYTIDLNRAYLKNLNLSEPKTAKHEINVEATNEGKQLENLDFKVDSK